MSFDDFQNSHSVSIDSIALICRSVGFMIVFEFSLKQPPPLWRGSFSRCALLRFHTASTLRVALPLAGRLRWQLLESSPLGLQICRLFSQHAWMIAHPNHPSSLPVNSISPPCFRLLIPSGAPIRRLSLGSTGSTRRSTFHQLTPSASMLSSGGGGFRTLVRLSLLAISVLLRPNQVSLLTPFSEGSSSFSSELADSIPLRSCLLIERIAYSSNTLLRSIGRSVGQQFAFSLSRL